MSATIIHFLVTCNLFFCLATTATTFAQQQEKKPEQEEVLRLKTELLEIRAVVTDKQSRPIEGLKKEDFELLENGRPQDISFFSEHQIKQRMKNAVTQPANPTAPEKTVTSSTDASRWIILFVDTLHLSGESLIRMKQMLKRYVNEQLTDQDSVMLLTSSGTESLAAHFTKDRQVLRYVIDRLTQWQAGQTSYFTPTLAAAIRRGDPVALSVGIKVFESEEHLNLAGMSGPMVRQMVESKALNVLSLATYRRNNLIAMLKAAASLMTELSGQRLMVLFSDGFTLMDTQGNPNTQDIHAVVSRAARAGVVIYAIRVRGLQPPAEFDASRPNISADSNILGRLSSYMSDSEKEDRDGLNALAKDTGGKFFFNTNDLGGALQKTIEENSLYYALSYYPVNEKKGNKFREITVRVKGHPDYIVRTQKGFLPADLIAEKKGTNASPQKKFFETIAAPMPATAIHISTTAAYLESGNDQAQVSIQVGIEGSNLNYREQNKQAALDLEIGGVIYDRNGAIVKMYTEKVKGNIPVEQVTEARRSGFQYGKRFELKPGIYQIRVGVRDQATDQVGTGVSWVQVPDLSKGKLTASSILLTDLTEQKPGLETEKAVVSEWRAIKSYKSGSRLVYYTMLYNLADKDETETHIQSEIHQGEAAVYQSDWQPLRSRVVGKERKGLEIGGQLNLSLERGIYELRLTIKNIRTNQTTRQSVFFAVED
jgi:VWFA-related protein